MKTRSRRRLYKDDPCRNRMMLIGVTLRDLHVIRELSYRFLFPNFKKHISPEPCEVEQIFFASNKLIQNTSDALYEEIIP